MMPDNRLWMTAGGLAAALFGIGWLMADPIAWAMVRRIGAALVFTSPEEPVGMRLGLASAAILPVVLTGVIGWLHQARRGPPTSQQLLGAAGLLLVGGIVGVVSHMLYSGVSPLPDFELQIAIGSLGLGRAFARGAFIVALPLAIGSAIERQPTAAAAGS